MNPVEYAWLIPVLLFVALLFSKRDTWMLPAVVPMITMSEVSQRIADVVRSIVMTIFEIARERGQSTCPRRRLQHAECRGWG
jgi:hypothetical protein